MEELKNYYKAILKEVTGSEIVAQSGPEKGLYRIQRYMGLLSRAKTGDPIRRVNMMRQLGADLPRGDGEYLRSPTNPGGNDAVHIDINRPDEQQLAKKIARNRRSGMRHSPFARAQRLNRARISSNRQNIKDIAIRGKASFSLDDPIIEPEPHGRYKIIFYRNVK
jgi:hypothetical protein